MSTQRPAKPKLLIKEIPDLYTRRNFEVMKDYFETQNQLMDFNFLEIILTQAETAKKIYHGLGYTPKDVIVTQVTGSGTFTFNYSSFDNNYLSVTCTGAVRIRCMLGTYWKDLSTTVVKTTDTQQVASQIVAASSTTTTTSNTTYVISSVSSGNNAYLLPDATKNVGKDWFIQKGDTSTNSLGITSTAGQTIGGRTSGSILLARYGDFAHIVSVNGVWQVLSKRETQLLTATGSTAFAASLTNVYKSASALVTLTPGTWRLTGQIGANMGVAGGTTYVQVLAGSGFYASDGSNSSVAPANLSSYLGQNSLIMNSTGPANTSAGGFAGGCVGPIVIAVTSNTGVYLVPQLNSSASSTGSVVTMMTAERVW